MNYVFLLYVYDTEGDYLEECFASKVDAEAYARKLGLTSKQFWIRVKEVL